MMRRVLSAVLLLLLAASVIGWILHVPASVTNRARAIPAYAQIVYSSKTPDWFVSFFPILGSFGAAEDGVFPSIGKTNDEFSNDWEKKFQGLEKHPLTVAAVPLHGRERRNSWVAVSAVGSRAVGLRWQLELFPPEGIRRVRSYSAWPVWQLDHPDLPAWARVRFSLADGLLICSISDDSHDIYWLLDTLDGRRISMADRKEQ